MMDKLNEMMSDTDWGALLTDWGLRLLAAILVFIIGRWIARWLANSAGRVMTSRQVDETLVAFLSNLSYAFLLTAVILAALDSLGVPITSLLAILGAAGLAIGLALKDSLANFSSGVMLVLFKPFSKGDFVEVADVTGKVVEVKIFSTYLTTPDNKRVIVPNGQISSDKITNYTAMGTRRIDMVIGVGYDDDLKVARNILEKVCKEHPNVLDDPEPTIMVYELGASSVDFAVRPWTRTEDYWGTRSDILETAKAELEAAGCNIPYPQSDVHLHKVED